MAQTMISPKSPKRNISFQYSNLPTSKDYMAIFQQFTSNEGSITPCGSDRVPFMNPMLLPSPIRFNDVPSIVTSRDLSLRTFNNRNERVPVQEIESAIDFDEDSSNVHVKEEEGTLTDCCDESNDFDQIPTDEVIGSSLFDSHQYMNAKKEQITPVSNYQDNKNDSTPEETEVLFDSHDDTNVKKEQGVITDCNDENDGQTKVRKEKITPDCNYKDNENDSEDTEISFDSHDDTNVKKEQGVIIACNDENDDQTDTVHAEKGSEDTSENSVRDDFVLFEDAKIDDILSYRGSASSQHTGNLRFRELVSSLKPVYEANRCNDYRRSLAVHIVEALHPGRFLKVEGNVECHYRVLPYEEAVTKALFAMRDCKSFKTKTKIKKLPSDDSAHPKPRGKVLTTPSSKKRHIDSETTPSKKLKEDDSSSTFNKVELRSIQNLIYKKNPSDGCTMATRARSNPRCEEVYACIENTVDMIKHNYMDSVISPDKSWYHPAMQQCIRLQVNLFILIALIKHVYIYENRF